MDIETLSPIPFTSPEHLRVGGPARIVLLADRLLLGPMRETVQAMEGVQLVGAFERGDDLVDWAMWKRVDWDVAFVDFALRSGSPAGAAASLLSQARPGEVVALGASRWPEMQQACSTMGIHRILDRGNLSQLRGYMEQWIRHGCGLSVSSPATPAEPPAAPAGCAPTSA